MRCHKLGGPCTYILVLDSLRLVFAADSGTVVYEVCSLRLAFAVVSDIVV